jgi:hypothetical protein
MLKLFIRFFIIVLCTTQLWSQEITGNLEGWILGSDNEPLPDVNISVSGSSLQGLRGTASNNDGYFRVVALPVGKYTVEVNHVAYTETIYENVKIHLGKTTTLGEILLQLKTLEMRALTVTVDRPIIDPTTTTSGLNLEYDNIESLPANRDYHSVVALTPQANTSFYGDEVNISGSTGMENVYYIDGVNVTNPYDAFRSTNLPYNFIKEIEVKTGGYEAEYGSALGGVVNVITHSGGNQLSGNGFGFFTNNKFAGERRAGVVASNVQDFSSYDFGLSLGGPLIRDKLWFFMAYNPQFEIENIVIPELGTYQDKLVSHIFAGKLTWKVSDKTNMVFNVFGDPNRHDLLRELPIPLLAIENEDVILTKREAGNINFSLNSRSMITEQILVEANITRIMTKEKVQGATKRARNEPLFLNLETGSWSGGAGEFIDNSATRTSAAVKASFFLGRHTLKTGLEYEDNLGKRNEYFTGSGYEGDIGIIIRFSDSSYLAWAGISKANVHNRIPALFIQDAWQVNPRFLLQLGLRWSGEFMVGSDGKLAQTISDEFQPRIGFVIQPGDLGSQKIYGSYGRFYEKIPPEFSAYYHTNTYRYELYFDHNPLEDPSGGDTLTNLSSSITEEIEGLGGQYIDEFTLGYEREISNRITLGVLGTYRYLGRVIEDVYNPTLDKFIIGNPGKGNLSFVPERKRSYMALQVSFQKSAERGLNLFASYTVSRLYGNYIGLYDQDSGQSIANSSPNADFVEQYHNSTGLLPNDRTHVFKLWGSYRFSFGLNLGTTFFWQSGAPLNNFGVTSHGYPWYSFLQQRGTAGRMPNLWDLALRFSYNLGRLYPSSLDTKLILDLLHIGNPREAVDFDQVHYYGVDENGNQTDENSNYLMPIQFQSPFTFRFGLELGF